MESSEFAPEAIYQQFPIELPGRQRAGGERETGPAPGTRAAHAAPLLRCAKRALPS